MSGAGAGHFANSNNHSNSNVLIPAQCSIFISNLTWWTTEDDIRRALGSDLGTRIKELQFLEHKPNGKSKGMVIVEFLDLETADVGKSLLEGCEINGKVCEVSFSRSPPIRPYESINHHSKLQSVSHLFICLFVFFCFLENVRDGSRDHYRDNIRNQSQNDTRRRHGDYGDESNVNDNYRHHHPHHHNHHHHPHRHHNNTQYQGHQSHRQVHREVAQDSHRSRTSRSRSPERDRSSHSRNSHSSGTRY
jgi:RNA recognition motif-containing protein